MTTSVVDWTSQKELGSRVKWLLLFTSLMAVAMAHLINMEITGARPLIGFSFAVSIFLYAITAGCVGASKLAKIHTRYGTPKERFDARNVQALDILTTLFACGSVLMLSFSLPFETPLLDFSNWSITSESNEMPLLASYIMLGGGKILLLVACGAQLAEVAIDRKYLGH